MTSSTHLLLLWCFMSSICSNNKHTANRYNFTTIYCIQHYFILEYRNYYYNLESVYFIVKAWWCLTLLQLMVRTFEQGNMYCKIKLVGIQIFHFCRTMKTLVDFDFFDSWLLILRCKLYLSTFCPIYSWQVEYRKCQVTTAHFGLCITVI